jgi:hypothetical protein
MISLSHFCLKTTADNRPMQPHHREVLVALAHVIDGLLVALPRLPLSDSSSTAGGSLARPEGSGNAGATSSDASASILPVLNTGAVSVSGQHAPSVLAVLSGLSIVLSRTLLLVGTNHRAHQDLNSCLSQVMGLQAHLSGPGGPAPAVSSSKNSSRASSSSISSPGPLLSASEAIVPGNGQCAYTVMHLADTDRRILSNTAVISPLSVVLPRCSLVGGWSRY